VPVPVLMATVKTAMLLSRGQAGLGVVSTKVLALTEGVLHTMCLTQVKLVTAVALTAVAVLCLALGGWTYHQSVAAEPGAQPAAVPAAPVQSPDQPKKDKQGKPTTLKGWGRIVDPDGECKFDLNQGKLTLKIPGKDHALAFERNQMNAPRILQEVEGDFIVQVKVSGNYPAGATSVVQGRRPFHGAGLVLWQDEKNYIRLEHAELVSDNQNIKYASWELRKDGQFARQGNTGDLPLTEQEYYLRLEKRDGKVFASVSKDGIAWSSLEPIDVELPNRVLVGVVAGHNTSSAFEVHFSEFRLFKAVGK
jgi:regulation of enolase protein 1 (concanavalin A-like superfamily)